MIAAAIVFLLMFMGGAINGLISAIRRTETAEALFEAVCLCGSILAFCFVVNSAAEEKPVSTRTYTVVTKDVYSVAEMDKNKYVLPDATYKVTITKAEWHSWGMNSPITKVELEVVK